MPLRTSLWSSWLIVQHHHLTSVLHILILVKSQQLATYNSIPLFCGPWDPSRCVCRLHHRKKASLCKQEQHERKLVAYLVPTMGLKNQSSSVPPPVFVAFGRSWTCRVAPCWVPGTSWQSFWALRHHRWRSSTWATVAWEMLLGTISGPIPFLCRVNSELKVLILLSSAAYSYLVEHCVCLFPRLPSRWFLLAPYSWWWSVVDGFSTTNRAGLWPEDDIMEASKGLASNTWLVKLSLSKNRLERPDGLQVRGELLSIRSLPVPVSCFQQKVGCLRCFNAKYAFSFFKDHWLQFGAFLQWKGLAKTAVPTGKSIGFCNKLQLLQCRLAQVWLFSCAPWKN